MHNCRQPSRSASTAFNLFISKYRNCELCHSWKTKLHCIESNLDHSGSQQLLCGRSLFTESCFFHFILVFDRLVSKRRPPATSLCVYTLLADNRCVFTFDRNPPKASSVHRVEGIFVSSCGELQSQEYQFVAELVLT